MKQKLLALLLALILPALAQTSDYPRHLEARLTMLTDFQTLLTQLMQQISADVRSFNLDPPLYHRVEESLREKAEKLSNPEGLEPPPSAAEAQEALEDCSRQARRCLKELRCTILDTEALAWVVRHPTSALEGNAFVAMQSLEQVRVALRNLERGKLRLREKLSELKPGR
jgi:hypothetical protein